MHTTFWKCKDWDYFVITNSNILQDMGLRKNVANSFQEKRLPSSSDAAVILRGP